MIDLEEFEKILEEEKKEKESLMNDFETYANKFSKEIDWVKLIEEVEAERWKRTNG